MSDEQTVLLFLENASKRTRLNRLLSSLGDALSLLLLLGFTVLAVKLLVWIGVPVLGFIHSHFASGVWPFSLVDRIVVYVQNGLATSSQFGGRAIVALFILGTLASLALLIRAWLRPVAPLAVAQDIDARFQLKDRISSALEFVRRKESSDFVRAALADAAEHMDRVGIEQAVPVRMSRSVKLASTLPIYSATVALALIIGLILTVAIAPSVTKANSLIKVDTGNIRNAVEALKEEAVRNGDKAAERLAQKIDDILSQMQRGELSKEDALKKMADLQREIQKQEEEGQNVKETLDKMASGFARSQMTSEVADKLQQQKTDEASDKLEQLSQQVGDGSTSSQQSESMQNALNAASQAAANSGNQDLKQLGKDLQQSAQQMGKGDKQGGAQQMKQAAQDMKNLAQKQGDNQRLDEANRQLDEARDALKSAGNQQQQNAQSSGKGQGQKQQEGAQSNQNQQGSNQAGGKSDGKNSQSDGEQTKSQGEQNGANAQGKGLDAGAQAGDKRPTDPSQRNGAQKKEEVQGEANKQPPPTKEDKKSDLTATTGYRNTVADADKAAQDVINHDDIPPSYRRIVKKYFNSIKPKN